MHSARNDDEPRDLLKLLTIREIAVDVRILTRTLTSSKKNEDSQELEHDENKLRMIQV